MKITLKALSLFLLSVLLLLSISSCSAQNTNSQTQPDTDTSTEEDEQLIVNPPEYYDEPQYSLPDGRPTITARIGKKDFGGQEIRFIVSGAVWEEDKGSLQTRSIALMPLDDTSYAVNQAVIMRNKQVENELNVKIKLEYTVDNGALTDHLTPIFASKVHTYDVVVGCQYYDIGLNLGNNNSALVDLNSLDREDNYIHLDSSYPYYSYWDKTTYESVSYMDKAYWLTGDISLSWVGGMAVSFVNKSLWDQYTEVISEHTGGITDLYELVEKKMWTLNLISAISKDIWVDKNSNETVDYGDVVGFISYKNTLNCVMTDVLAAGADITYSKLNTEGVPEISFYNNRTSVFATKLVNLYTKSNSLLVDWDDEKYVVEMFAEGNVLFTPNYLHSAESSLREMTDTYLILPPPLLIKGDDYSTCLGDSVSQFAILSTVLTDGDLGATTATLDAMALYSQYYVTPTYYDQILGGKYSTDYEMQKRISFIRNSIKNDFALIWDQHLGGVSSFFRLECTQKHLTSKIKRQNDTWSESLNTLLEEIEATYLYN